MNRSGNQSRAGKGRGVLWAIITALLLATLLQFGPWPSAWLEWLYRTVLYPAWSPLSSSIVDATSLSVSAGVATLLALVPLLQLMLLRRRRWRVAGLTFGASLALLALLFPLTFGLAYRLEPLEQRLGLSAPLNVAERQRVESWVLEQLQEAARAAPSSAAQRWLVCRRAPCCASASREWCQHGCSSRTSMPG